MTFGDGIRPHIQKALNLLSDIRPESNEQCLALFEIKKILTNIIGHESGLFECRLEPATVNDWARFLMAHIKRGGKPTHRYDYPFRRSGIFIAKFGGFIIRGSGVNAINVIAPRGVEVTRIGEGIDHGNTYHMDGSGRTPGWVPIYPDVEEGIDKILAREKAFTK